MTKFVRKSEVWHILCNLHPEKKHFTMNEFNSNQRPTPLMGGRPQPGFMDAVKTCLTEKYCCFKGRARRAEFWWFQLFLLIVSTVLSFAFTFSMLAQRSAFLNDPMTMFTSPAYIVLVIISLVLLLPDLGVTIRRLHDTGRSGWWVVPPIVFYILILVLSILISMNPESALSMGLALMLFYLALLASGIILIVWLCQDSYHGENRYGRSPKYQ